MPDISGSIPSGWVNVYTLAGVAVGTRMILQNQDPSFTPKETPAMPNKQLSRLP